MLASSLSVPPATADPVEDLEEWLEEVEALAWEYVNGFDPNATPQEQLNRTDAFVTAVLRPPGFTCVGKIFYAFRATNTPQTVVQVERDLRPDRLSVEVTISPTVGASSGELGVGITTLSIEFREWQSCLEDPLGDRLPVPLPIGITGGP